LGRVGVTTDDKGKEVVKMGRGGGGFRGVSNLGKTGHIAELCLAGFPGRGGVTVGNQTKGKNKEEPNWGSKGRGTSSRGHRSQRSQRPLICKLTRDQNLNRWGTYNAYSKNRKGWVTKKKTGNNAKGG